ncbi:hypothetical protein CL619_00430 [archaeon]|nr:hypothetical protein [archaeon]
MKIKIATWNMAYWSHRRHFEDAWDYFLNEIDADFYFFQEAKPPKAIQDNKEHIVWNEIGGTRKWGSGIYSKKYLLREEIINGEFADNSKGIVALANTKINEDHTLTLMSVYGLLETVGKAKYAATTMHRILSDFTGILNGHIGGKRKIVFGGDLNMSIQVDEWPNTTPNSHKIFFERLEDFGLLNCFKPFFKDYVQTHRHARSNKPWQNDYFFISKKMSKKLVNCEVIDNDKVRKYSDHNIVMITLDL